MNPNKLIETITIHAKGDPSVGIQETWLNISPISTFMDEEERETWRVTLSETFEQLIGENVDVFFDYEIKEATHMDVAEEEEKDSDPATWWFNEPEPNKEN
jgi:hypothetical protein